MSKKKLIGKPTKIGSRNKHDEVKEEYIESNGAGAMRNIPVDSIRKNPNQPRQYFDPVKMAELEDSIRESGVIQPVVVRFEGDAVYLVAGERRLRAARAAGLKKIPAIVTEGDPAHVALIENIQRDDLTPLEEAEAMFRMVEDRRCTQDDLAEIVGKAKSTVSEILSLNRLPETIKNEVRNDAHFPKRKLIEIARKKDTEEMLDLFLRIKEGRSPSEASETPPRKDGRRQKNPRRPPALIASQHASDLTRYITDKIDIKALSRDEKKMLEESLKRLVDSIHNYLTRLNEVP